MATLGALAAPRPLKAEQHGNGSPASVAFLLALWATFLFAIICLVTLLADITIDGSGRLDAALVTNYASQITPETGGVRAAILGSLFAMAITVVLAVPLGVGAAVYLQEFADPTRWWNRLVELNIQNLAAVPAIIYGMLVAGAALALPGLTRRSVLAGGIALALLILPVIIVTSREALKAVPEEIRLGSLALGVTPLKTAFRQTLPAAVPGIATGTILSLSRAIGEAAPLLLLGGLVFVNYDPTSLSSGFTTLPIQIYSWVQQPQAEFRESASAAIILLLALLLAMNALAIVIRNKFQHRW